MSDETANLESLDPESSRETPGLPAYEVGYRKPPRESRYPKGRSGNLKGRPKEVIYLLSSFEDMLNERDVTDSKGGPVMSKREAMVRVIFAQAARCNQKAFKKFMELAKRAGFLKRRPLTAAAQQHASTSMVDMNKFKAEFGKPLPNAGRSTVRKE